MGNELIVLSEMENVFSMYPFEMDKFFQDNTVLIKIIPDDLVDGLEPNYENILITSANEFEEYLNSEMEFWTEADPQGKLNTITHKDRLKSAKSKFEEALNLYSSGNLNASNILTNSVSDLSHGVLYSKTLLAKFLIAQITKDDYFRRGLKAALVKTKSSNPVQMREMDGYIAAHEFLRCVNDANVFSIEELDTYRANIETANDNFSKLNAKYTETFHEHEKRIDSIISQSNNYFVTMSENETAYFEEKEKHLAELENLYREKLKLEAPAEYWAKLEMEYTKRGKIWVVASLLLSAAIIGVLTNILNTLPNIIVSDSHWIDVLKSSAIITVIASIAVYMLRMFVKMVMSSFHLARDAKERNNLSYFYLALIEKGAVTEKERAIILNALFSRADTGLLKGDSTPAMSSNVTELVEALAKSNR